MTTRWFSYALKAKLPGSLCLIIIGTEGFARSRFARMDVLSTPPAVTSPLNH